MKMGKATVAVTADGLNVVGVEVAFPTQNKGEQNKYFSALSFLISPEGIIISNFSTYRVCELIEDLLSWTKGVFLYFKVL